VAETPQHGTTHRRWSAVAPDRRRNVVHRGTDSRDIDGRQHRVAETVMAIELRILSGARTGYSESFDKSVIALGRHPLSDFRFDPKQDLDVSTRHGEIRALDGRYAIYDANSTNGTF